MIITNCLFDSGKQCGILEVKKCGGCKFKKTSIEFHMAQFDAEQTLKRKGLRPVTKSIGGKIIMTVEEIEK